MTVMYLYYNQPDAIRFFESLGYQDLGINFLFVDDGSDIPLTCQWADVIRIDYDIPWNQPKANNTGFDFICYRNEKDSVLRMDIDHYFLPNDLIEINEYELFTRQLVTFGRKGIKPHPNIYLASVSDLMEAGGYNEEFCGNYGYDDMEFMNRLKKKKFKFTPSPIEVRVNHDLKRHGLNRDTTINKAKYLKLK